MFSHTILEVREDYCPLPSHEITRASYSFKNYVSQTTTSLDSINYNFVKYLILSGQLQHSDVCYF